MTRIVAGSAGGRRLAVPPRGTRPTTDRVREALFNVLAARLDFDGLRVLDLYAGSGALGLEALSRGADSLLLVDNDLRPIVMARGLQTPMVVILAGVICGTLAGGLIGLFIGPVVLAVFYDLVVAWIVAGRKADDAG